MTYKQLKEISAPHFYALSIDKYLPHIVRSIVRKTCAVLALFSFILSFASIDILPLDFSFADGFFFLFVFFYIIFALIEFFYHSMKNEGLFSRVLEKNLAPTPYLDYALSTLLYQSSDIDVTRALFESYIGMRILERAGLNKKEREMFVDGARTPIISSSINISTDHNSLKDYLGALYEADKYLSQFLNGHGIGKEEFIGAGMMEGEIVELKRRGDRFWARENLGTIPSIGKSWSYGVSYELGKFGTNFAQTVDLSTFNIENGYREKEVSQLETILERSEEANAVIVTNNESVARDVVARLLRKIRLGVALPKIEHKDIVELDWTSLMATFKQKGEIESEILKIMNQAIAAGNIILYVRDLPSFVMSAKQCGVNLTSLISPYLASSAINIIAHASNADFHFFIETSGELSERFERVLPNEVDTEATLQVVIEKVRAMEGNRKITMSYGAIKKVVESADRYMTEGEMPEKALDLLDEVLSVLASKDEVLKEEDVVAYVSEKTGVKLGGLSEDEIEKINNLEVLLHERVVGQEEAIKTISSAVRRSRSGLSNPKRPLGSFLFFGPTGVGKTETTKTLCQVYFGSEDKMLRIDMSEYSGFDALSRLIGSYADSKSGILASKIKDNPYGVLLLDEFEKASSEVHDLFLQILDEGFFSDALSNKVNCRNLMIIATSNAGSELISQFVAKGEAIDKEKVLDMIISQKVFKSELLNRFDGLVVFESLLNDDLMRVARLELEKFALRLKEREIDFVVTDELISYVAERGCDPKFGARSINRVIANNIEEVVAKKIINKEILPGEKLVLSISELS